MNKEEMDDFLNSIGGLENGFYPDRPKIVESYFFSVDIGWLQLIKDLITDLIALGWDKQVCQVKEKFGGLRFYINSGSDEIFKRISEAENQSYETCEVCGEKGEIRTDIGWYTTLCDEHYTQKKNEKNGRSKD
jgi:hypothetical protein